MTADAPPPLPASPAHGGQPTRVILEQGGGWSRWSGRVAWLVAGVAVLVALGSLGANATYFQTDTRVIEKYHSLSKVAGEKVAIVEISGAIMGGDGFARRQLERIEADEQVKAIVLRINSPGGTVSGSDELHYRISKLAEDRELPVVVSMGGIAASGGYYVAMANGGREDVIFAEPTTLTGSIGVIIPQFDLSALLERLDIADDSLASGPMKEMLSPTKRRTPEIEKEEREILQGLVDAMFARFRGIVADGRPAMDEAQLEAVSSGRIYTADQALEAGLVDSIGFLEDAIDRAVELAGLSQESTRVIRYSKPRGLLDEVVGGDVGAKVGLGPGGISISLDTLAEWTTPRCWYLCSWWPILVGS